MLSLLLALLLFGPAEDPIRWSACLDQEPAWYAGAEAVRIADNLLLYQHENGGWEKNLDYTRRLTEDDRRQIVATRGQNGGTTIDNGATHTQVRYLSMVYSATGHKRFRDAALRGIDFMLAAQYPNGGWPQFFPLRNGYYTHITFNDGAMIGVMRVLRDVAAGKAPFAFVEPGWQDRARTAVATGMDVILKTQVRVGGRLTAWCAQHDENDFSPAKARSYELPSLSGSESVGIVEYLMEIERPTPAVIEAVEGAVAWFESARILGSRVVNKPDSSLPRGYDRVVVADPSAPPIWARFYEIETNRPFFCGRDGVKKQTLAEIEHERRVGYSWLGEYASDLLVVRYPEWKKRVGR